MNLDDLKTHITETSWFHNLGHCPPREGIVTLENAEFLPDEVADHLIYLPSTADGEDFMRGAELKALAQSLGCEAEARAAGLEIYKLTLVSLRKKTEHPLLRFGPHDLTNAAQGAATFAMRRAAIEIMLDACGFWRSVAPYYFQGNWPVGTLRDGRVVVL